MNILVSILGSSLDNHGRGTGRWGVWRPSVALAMQEDMHFDRYYLIWQQPFERLMRQVAEDIRICSPDTEVIPEEIYMKNPWDFEEVYAKLYDFSRKMDFSSDDSNEYYVHITTGTHVAQICLFLLNESRHLPGKLLQTQPESRTGARGIVNVIDLDLSRYDQLAKRFAVERKNDLDFLKFGIATKNARFNSLIETIERVAVRSADPMLLTGPTGAGKSRLAERIYELKKNSGRLKGAFINTNCATLRGDQAMSTLFGHKKGAFTGAASDRSGLLRAADGGVLFLDEIGELGLDEQAMLLRAVEEKTFFPLGSDHEEKSDFQLICGTNRDLRAAAGQGRFRADLLARIDLWSFELPGLAARREDIAPNLDYELDRCGERMGRHIAFNREARARFMEYALDPATAWPGNFRELNAMVTRMVTLSGGGRIDLETVENELARCRAAERAQTPRDALLESLLGADCREKYDRFDLAALGEVLAVCRTSGNLAEAGKKLFAVSRRSKKSVNDSDRLSKYLARFGLDFATVRAE